jgi:hypothetical protein
MSDTKADPPLTEEQTKMLNDMRARYAQHPKWHANCAAPTDGQVTAPGVFTDIDLLRFLRARKWVYSAQTEQGGAIEQFEGSLKWRKTNDVDYILEFPPVFTQNNLIKKILPGHLGLKDKFGRPVIINCPGRINIGLVQKYVSVEAATKCQAFTQENLRLACRQQSLALGRPITKILSIVDLTGLSMDAMNNLAVVEAMFKIDERYYPETLGKTIVLNAPGIFSGIWAVIQKFLDPNVVAKVEIFGSGVSESVLRQYFDDLSVLPVELVPQGQSGMILSSDVKEITAHFEAIEAKTCKKGALSRTQFLEEKLRVDAREHPQMVEWMFKSDDDIKYSVFFQQDGRFFSCLPSFSACCFIL